MPEVHINPMAIVVAVIVNFILGFLWYTPLFGKVWGREMGMSPDVKPPAGALAKGMLFMVIGSILMAFVFAHNIAVWHPETWSLPPTENSPIMMALSASFFTWLGFFLPVDLGAVAWERKSWTLFFINTGYHFISLLVMALVLIYMM